MKRVHSDLTEALTALRQAGFWPVFTSHGAHVWGRGKGRGDRATEFKSIVRTGHDRFEIVQTPQSLLGSSSQAPHNPID